MLPPMEPNSALTDFHPTVRAWFQEELGAPTPAQEHGWPAIRAGEHTLIAAPTGSGDDVARLSGFAARRDSPEQLDLAGLELARDRLDPTIFQRATINAELFAPKEAARVGYLDQTSSADFFEANVLAAAQQLADLDPTAFAETKRRVRQPTIDRIRAREA